jgi:hypothetical protein
MKEWILIISTLVSVLGAESFADWMAKDYCDRPLAVGQVLYFTGLNERILPCN